MKVFVENRMDKLVESPAEQRHELTSRTTAHGGWRKHSCGLYKGAVLAPPILLNLHALFFSHGKSLLKFRDEPRFDLIAVAVFFSICAGKT